MNPLLLKVCEIINFKAGEVVFNQGDKPTGMYVIRSGEVSVERDGKQITILKAGDFFGVMGLILHEKRSATIRAVTDISTDYLSIETFEEVRDDLGDEVIDKALERYSETYKNVV